VLGQHQQQFQQLFQLAQGAAYVWDNHNSHLAELDQQLSVRICNWFVVGQVQ